MIVLGGVLALRAIATAYMAAREADAKMNPGFAGLQAFFATVGVWMLVHIHFGYVAACRAGVSAHDCVNTSLFSREATISDSFGGWMGS